MTPKKNTNLAQKKEKEKTGKKTKNPKEIYRTHYKTTTLHTSIKQTSGTLLSPSTGIFDTLMTHSCIASVM